MKVTYNWLRDFVDIKITPQELADRLTMAGLEVVSLENREGDFVFEIEITSNRPDWLSVSGIAREVAAITKSKIKLQKSKIQQKISNKTRDSRLLKIEIENKKDCPLYTAKIIQGVKVGPSPQWMKNRLEAVGCRSINNIVDITNYVLFETGEPLHAFDLDKIPGDKIIVRRGLGTEKLLTLDGKERQIDKDILVIADEKKPLAAAGIMGGWDSEVDERTKNILLEAAIFDPVLIRRCRQNLGLQTESSYRFERGIDSETVVNASYRAADLINNLTSGKLVLSLSCGSVSMKPKVINLKAKTAAAILGVDIPEAKIKAILNNLGFKIKNSGAAFGVAIPPFRQDVNQEIDLVEEIARVFGYDKIPVSLPSIKPAPEDSREINMLASLRGLLSGLGLNEVITHTLVPEDYASITDTTAAIIEGSMVRVANPLSKDQAVLRQTVIPSIAKCVAYNFNQKQDLVNIFEISRVFSRSNSIKEDLVLAIAISGERKRLSEGGLAKETMGLLHVKGIISKICSYFGIDNYCFEEDRAHGQIIIKLGNSECGFMAGLGKRSLEKLDVKNRDVFVAQVKLDDIFSCAQDKKVFKPLPVYPAITRDISFVVKNSIKVEDILRIVKQNGADLLESANVSDYYKGKQIPNGFKGLTISCVYRSFERTLTESEVNPLNTQITSILIDKLGVKLR